MSAKICMKFQNLCFKFQNLCFYISGSGSLYLGTKFFVIMFHTLFLGYKIDVFRFWNLFFCQNTLQNLRFGYVKYCPYCCLILLSYSNHFFHVKKLWKMYFFFKFPNFYYKSLFWSNFHFCRWHKVTNCHIARLIFYTLPLKLIFSAYHRRRKVGCNHKCFFFLLYFYKQNISSDKINRFLMRNSISLIFQSFFSKTEIFWGINLRMQRLFRHSAIGQFSRYRDAVFSILLTTKSSIKIWLEQNFEFFLKIFYSLPKLIFFHFFLLWGAVKNFWEKIQNSVRIF